MENRISLPRTLEENCMHLYLAAGRNNIRTPSTEVMIYLAGVMTNTHQTSVNINFVVGSLKELDRIAKGESDNYYKSQRPFLVSRYAKPYLVSKCSGDFHMNFDSQANALVSKLAQKFYERALDYSSEMGRQTEPLIISEILEDFEKCVKLLSIANAQSVQPGYEITDNDYLDFYDAFSFAFQEAQCKMSYPEVTMQRH